MTSSLQKPSTSAARRRKWPWIVGGVAVIVMLGCSAGGNDATAGADDAPSEQAVGKETNPKTKAKQDKKPGLNDPVRDGKFEFTATRVKCGATKVGSGLVSEKAQGQYCLITLRVKNIGKEAQAFADSAQKA